MGSTMSKELQINRGMKQGDSLSPALFNAVLEDFFCSIQPHWGREGYGIDLEKDARDILTNLQFADDLLLVGTSKEQIQHVLEDLISAAG